MYQQFLFVSFPDLFVSFPDCLSLIKHILSQNILEFPENEKVDSDLFNPDASKILLLK